MPIAAISAHRTRIATALRQRRDALIAALRDGATSQQPRVNRFNDAPADFDQRIGTWIDLLIGHLEERPGFDALLASQTLLEIYRPELDPATNRVAINAALEATWADLSVASALSAADLAELQHVLNAVTIGMRSEPRAHVKTLLIGDCLMGEIAGFAAPMLSNAGIGFDPFPLNGRDPADLNRQIERSPNQTFDAIFFSPFSHARMAEIDVLLDPKRAFERGAKLEALIDSILAQTQAILTYLAGRFECPIYVHNAGLVARSTTALKGGLRNALTAPRRKTARDRINQWLTGFVDARNSVGPRQIHIIDEAAIVQRQGNAAGRYLYASDFLHATALSLELAREYQRRIAMLATLKGKKLVVCDLDHTLWDGVIGEGAVTHFADRQQALRRLKEKSGVVLTIASKNDPERVHFTGGVLALEDFVAPQISWGRKVEAVARLRQQLNLQYRHMVFIDDRPDERAFMAEAYPDMLVLDATDAESWAGIGLWADATEGSSDLDRTQLYQQQLERDAFVGEGQVAQLSDDFVAKLDLKIDVRDAGKSDLKRFVELINRTNQWNLTGARTSLAAVKDQAGAPDALLLLASASDKFGDMGDVCAAIVTISDAQATIDSFVLSCRVFGYGVESAMLEAIREKARAKGAITLNGTFLPTTQNHMARDMYADHGFSVEAEGRFQTAL